MPRLQHIIITAHRACRCDEKKKPLKERNWRIESYLPSKCYGPNASSYDGRKLLRLYCRSCGAYWQNKNKHSPLWDIINETPYS